MLLHGRGGHKDKYKDKDTDKYKVLQRPNVCYIFEEQGVLGGGCQDGGHGHSGHGYGGHGHGHGGLEGQMPCRTI